MKRHYLPIIAAIGLLVASPLNSHASIPPEMTEVLANQFSYSYRSDLMSAEDPVFVDYIHKNWREIADNIEWLPLQNGERIPEKVAFNASVMHFGQTCEGLPPLEYLDFFEKILSLAEEKRISYDALEFLFMPEDEKYYFFPVNWEHPRVRKIFERMRKLVPPDDETMLNLIDKEARGELADNYLTNKDEDAPRPQTLPGIKLQRPWASLIEKYERVTGKKVPPDPEFDPRPERRGEGNDSGTAEVSNSGTSRWLQVLVAGVAVIAAAFGIWKYRKVKTVVR